MTRRAGFMGDRRVIAGAVLVLSAVVGALVFRSADAAPDRVLAAAHDIAAGAPVGPEDLEAVPVRVSEVARATMVAAGEQAALSGRRATRRLSRGDLLRRTDLALSGPAFREVSIPVAAEHVPSGRISPGDRVDVLATYGEGTAARTVVVAKGVEVVGVTSQQSLIGGTDSGALAAVTVACDARVASLLVFSARSAKVDIVRSLGAEADEASPVGFGDLSPVTGTAAVGTGG